MMEDFDNETETKKYLMNTFSEKTFTQEEIAAIDQALTQEPAAQA
jgi:hypothetical protein